MRSLKLKLAWVLVGLPLAWGVYHSVKKSMPLFDRKTGVAVRGG
jgi:hypothetical protein